jgi:hypothetical protein
MLNKKIAFTACLGAILEVIDTSIVNVALTDIQASLGATVTEVGWMGENHFYYYISCALWYSFVIFCDRLFHSYPHSHFSSWQ